MNGITVVRRSALAYTADGPTRGYAHIGMPGVPADGRGRLDFDPLLLVGDGRMYPGEGFDMHRHEHIENVLMVLRGRLRHRDSTGQDLVLGSNDTMLMSAGAGGEHTERVQGEEPLRALVIWLRAVDPDAPCRYARSHVPLAARTNELVDIVGGSGVPWECDARIRRATLDAGASVAHTVGDGRRCYVIALGPDVVVGEHELADSDRLLATGPHALRITADAPGDVVLIDMATTS